MAPTLTVFLACWEVGQEDQEFTFGLGFLRAGLNKEERKKWAERWFNQQNICFSSVPLNFTAGDTETGGYLVEQLDW